MLKSIFAKYVITFVVLLFFILGCEFFINYKLQFRKHVSQEVKA